MWKREAERLLSGSGLFSPGKQQTLVVPLLLFGRLVSSVFPRVGTTVWTPYTAPAAPPGAGATRRWLWPVVGGWMTA